MQLGSLARVSRKEGPAVWQFRWSEKGWQQRKRVIGHGGSAVRTLVRDCEDNPAASSTLVRQSRNEN
jgi:hypothetical protein